MLQPFESRDVLQASMRITRAGDGLSTALTIEPVELHIGDTLFVLLECTVGEVSLRPLKDTEVLVRRHTLIAGVGTVVDGKWAREAVDKQKKKNLQAAGAHELFDEGE